MNEITKYREEGFTGFVKVANLRLTSNIIPPTEGVYVVLRATNDKPIFLEEGTGGHFKDRNPNVPIAELEKKFVGGSDTMYIGKATNLHKRLGQLLRFGAGANVGHWGGRYLWQLADSDNLLIAWKETYPSNSREVEFEMLTTYRNEHGRLPFANLTI